MPEYISPDFEPSKETYRVLQSNGIPREFLDQYVTEHFIEYWLERKEKAIAGELNKRDTKASKKTAWQTTYRVWARRSFHGKPGREYEERRHQNWGGRANRIMTGEDLFTIPSGKEVREQFQPTQRPRHKIPERPPAPDGPTNSEEAIALMKKTLGVK